MDQTIEIFRGGLPWIRFLATNVLFTLNHTTHSSKTILCVVRFNVNKMLVLAQIPYSLVLGIQAVATFIDFTKH